MIRLATGIVALLAVLAAPAAAELTHETVLGGVGGPVNAANDPISITQSQDTSTASDMVACGLSSCTPDGVFGCTTENHWGRIYDLDSVHSINDPFAINSVDVGHVVSSTETGTTNTLEVNLYTVVEPAPLSVANTTSIGGTSVEIPGDGSVNGAIENIAVAGLVDDPNTKDLVVEQFHPQDGTVSPFRAYRAGGNLNGEFASSYLYSDSCALTDWTAFSAIGFGQIHLVQVVNGKIDGGSTPTESASWGSIKQLYQ